MRPIDWLLLLLAEAPAPLDPVRLQKGMFLLAAETPLPPSDAYVFVPYSYGPMSSAIYRDARTLCATNLTHAKPVPGHRWRTLAIAPAGAERAPLLLARARRECPAGVEQLRRVRTHLDTMDFATLLEHVYERHPAYASRSVFRRP